ncbi:FAD binding domain protein [Stachybotrys elegans]|uniref:FAD binding domain protein n=1 Tax=Stachybotrys elegans TaxID=80388 RepID=A0A8K0T517_9HYPO|nr:FAD binding domain protein [Stachybotrys elegans]
MFNLSPASVIAVSLLVTSAWSAKSDCKCTPHDPCWPSTSDFARLNESVSGRLIATTPPASVCYPTQHDYDPAQCEGILARWFDAAFHTQDPTSVCSPVWAGNPCPPIYPNGTSVTGDPDAGAKGCNVGGYPAYAVNATEPSHAQEAVKFAAKHNIRLNVKSTGHSFQGRSTAFGSLSVYTHNFRGIQFHEQFQPACCSQQEPQMAATIRAGETIRAIYTELSKHNAVVVGGSAQTVGIMGWFTGGGHGPLSSEFGMGVDNVLQVTMVTPQGDLVTANACQHPDLFWAIRGGGGGTFGIVLEVVMRAHPSPRIAAHSLSAQFTSPSEAENWRMVAKLHSEMPRLKEGGMQGYYYVLPPSIAGALTIMWGFVLCNKPNGTAESLFEPIARLFDENPGTVRYASEISHYPDFFNYWNSTIGFEAVAQSATMGSRLLPAQALTDVDRLSDAFQRATAPSDAQIPVIIIGHMIANSDNAGLDVPLHPGWRRAVTHLILVEPYRDYIDAAAKEEVYGRMTYERVPILEALAPGSGAYFNEADPFDPQFQETFWADNYSRLKSIKDKYDPDSVLWCISCVGSEDWVIGDGGRLCPAT